MNRLALFTLLLFATPQIARADDFTDFGPVGQIEAADFALRPILDHNGFNVEPQDKLRWRLSIKPFATTERRFITTTADQSWQTLENITVSQPDCVAYYVDNAIPGGGARLTVVVMNDGGCDLPQVPILVEFDLKLIDDGGPPDTAQVSSHFVRRLGQDLQDEKDITRIVDIWQPLP